MITGWEAPIGFPTVTFARVNDLHLNLPGIIVGKSYLSKQINTKAEMVLIS